MSRLVNLIELSRILITTESFDLDLRPTHLLVLRALRRHGGQLRLVRRNLRSRESAQPLKVGRGLRDGHFLGLLRGHAVRGHLPGRQDEAYLHHAYQLWILLRRGSAPSHLGRHFTDDPQGKTSN